MGKKRGKHVGTHLDEEKTNQADAGSHRATAKKKHGKHVGKHLDEGKTNQADAGSHRATAKKKRGKDVGKHLDEEQINEADAGRDDYDFDGDFDKEKYYDSSGHYQDPSEDDKKKKLSDKAEGKHSGEK